MCSELTRFEALFEISQLKDFRAAKAAAVLLYLRDALGVSITDSSIASKVFSSTCFAATTKQYLHYPGSGGTRLPFFRSGASNSL